MIYKDPNFLLQIAATAEQGSEHPLASAICVGAQARNLALPLPETLNITISTGGVLCLCSDGRKIGKQRWQ